MSGVLLSRMFVERFSERLAEIEAIAGGGIERIVMDTEAGGADLSLDDLNRIEGGFFSNDIRYDRTRFMEALYAAPNLKWLHFFAVGLDPRAYPELRERGVRITNSPGANAEPIALTVLGAILSFSRPFSTWKEAQERHSWEPIHYDDAPCDLAGQVMVIIGTGEIGSRIARYTQGIGMRVIGVQRSTPTTEQPFEEVHHPSKLHELLPRAEWLVVACPLTDETRGMVDEHAFSLLPRGAHLINVARGAIVDELAMIEALSSGVLGGAYLDVTAQEPLPTESPLWAFPNVLVTPHNSSISASYADRSAEMFFANLVRWGRGEALQNFVG